MHFKRLLETNFKEEEQINSRRRSQKRCLKQEAVTQRCSINKVILKILQNSQGKPELARVFCLIKLQAEACNFI